MEKLQLACKLHDWNALPPYIDDGYSGKNMDRPAMKRLMQDAGKGLFSLIVVYKLDRLSRRLSDCEVVYTFPLRQHSMPQAVQGNKKGGFLDGNRPLSAPVPALSGGERFALLPQVGWSMGTSR